MEVLRPSTPAPYPIKVSKTFRNRKYPSSSCLPHLQPLLEDRLINSTQSKTGELVRQFHRHSIACAEHADEELFQISNSHGRVLRIQDNNDLRSSLSRRLPCISKEELNEVHTLKVNKTNFVEKDYSKNKRDGKVQSSFTNRLRTSNSLKTTNSLPTLGKEKRNRKDVKNRTNEYSMLDKHIQQEEKNFDPERNKDVIFERFFETQH